MPDQEFEYDVFLSYTEANKADAQNLYERLRNEAIRFFFFLPKKPFAPARRTGLKRRPSCET